MKPDIKVILTATITTVYLDVLNTNKIQTIQQYTTLTNILVHSIQIVHSWLFFSFIIKKTMFFSQSRVPFDIEK